MKRIVTIQDISAVGKCSLTVALPIISAMGVECAVLPTAVLSNHTAFSGFTFHDLTSEIEPIANQWKKENLYFDAIYTGYLGSFEQIRLMENFFDEFGGENTFTLVDPAMADNGALYKGFTPEFAHRMARLCGKADLCVPNLTEASFMLDVEYREKYDLKYVTDILKKLCELGAKRSALTGVSFEEGKIGVAGFDPKTGVVSTYFTPRLPVAFHGTGDIYASTVCGALMRGFSVENALALGADYTVECIRKTMQNENHNWYGVDFESAIPYLVGRLEKDSNAE